MHLWIVKHFKLSEPLLIRQTISQHSNNRLHVWCRDIRPLLHSSFMVTGSHPSSETFNIRCYLLRCNWHVKLLSHLQGCFVAIIQFQNAVFLHFLFFQVKTYSLTIQTVQCTHNILFWAKLYGSETRLTDHF